MTSTRLRAPSRQRFAYLTVAAIVAAVLTGSNLPTLYYPFYQAKFGLSAFEITLIFAVYVATMVPSLLAAGRVSDVVGRRPILLVALAIAVLAGAGFAWAPDAAWLFVLRACQGCAVGAVSGPGLAALRELQPEGNAQRATAFNTVAVLGGGALGPLVGGVAAQILATNPTPLFCSYALLGALLALPAWILVPTPQRRTGLQLRSLVPRTPGSAAPGFILPALSVAAAFAVNGLFLSLVPIYVRQLIHTSMAAVLSGGVIALFFASGAVTQLAARGKRATVALVVGLAAVITGLAATVGAGAAGSGALMLVGAVIGGAGQGLSFYGGLATALERVHDDRAGDVSSWFYVVAYLGVGVPVLGVGLIAPGIGLYPAVRDFAVVIGAACLLCAVLMGRRAKRTTRSGETNENGEE